MPNYVHTLACVARACYPERTPPQPDQAKCVQPGLDSAKRQHRREEKRAKQGGLNPAQAKIAMAVHILGGYDVVMAGTFASLKTQATGSDGVESLGTKIRNMCLAVPLDSLLRFEIPIDRGAKQFAQQLSNSSRSTGLSVTSLTPTRPKVSRLAHMMLLRNTSDSVMSWVPQLRILVCGKR